MVKKTLLKEIYYSIKKEYKRFLFLVLILFLGVGFFVGMKSSSPLLKNIATKYVNNNNFMDIRIISEMGLDDAELSDLKLMIDDVNETEGSYEIDVVSNISGVDVVVSVNSYRSDQKLNQIELLSGKLPSNIHECVVEEGIINAGYKIGDIIDLNSENLEDDTVVITGVVRSPMYISPNRGTSTLLSGRITYYVYAYADNFKFDYYTSGYLALDNKYTSFTDEYNEYVEGVEEKIKNISSLISQKRFKTQIDDMTSKVNEMERSYNDAYNTLHTQLVQAEREIDSAEAKIENGYNTLESEKKKIEALLVQKQKELDTAKSALDTAKKALDTSKELYEKSQSLDNNSAYKLLLQQKKIYETKIESLEREIDYYSDKAEKARVFKDTYLKLKEKKEKELQETQNLLDNINRQINEFQITIAYPEYIIYAENEYNSNLAKYNLALIEFDKSKKTAYEEVEKAEKELKKNQSLLNTKKAEFNSTKTTKTKQLEKYKTELESARDQLSLFKVPAWISLSRSDISSYSQYSDDVESVSNLGKIFPIVFFLVACLMTMTSISRMIEQERSQIGTLKAFGYTNNQVLFKYIFYALCASLIGSLLGVIGGLTIIPYVIFKIYQLMYSLPNFSLQFNVMYALTGTLIAVSITVLTTYLVCRSTFKEIPCKLMKAKVSKSNKKILIEYLPFIWKKLKLTRKISIKNLFLYKKRLLMTIAGVAGCTALIVAGLGLQSSITDVVPLQFGKLFDLNVQLYYKNDISRTDIETEAKRISDFDNVEKTALAHIEVIKIKIDSKTHDVNFVITNDYEKFNSIVNINVDGKKIEKMPEDGVIISNKLAKFLKVKKGDTLSFTDNAGDEFKVKIVGTCENYVEHYVYMSEALYKVQKNVSPRQNMLLVKTTNDYDEREFANLLNKNNKFASMTFISVVEDAYQDILHNLNLIVIVIIISAGLLAIVVLLNLSSINISERKRELATLKVLGFTKKEVNNYVKKEMQILSVIGVIVGLALGYVMTNVVINLCEIDQLEFVKTVVWKNYLYAALITLVFSFIANNVAMKEIQKINMTESLKSID